MNNVLIKSPPSLKDPHYKLSISSEPSFEKTQTDMYTYINTLVLLSIVAMTSAVPLETRNAAAINAGAISLIESLEGFRGDYYYINGDKTIGFGHDCTQRGGCTSLQAPITRAQGTTLLKSDLKEYESCVCAMPNAADLNANEYGALVSFTYNSGCGGLQNYWTSAMKKKNFKGICEALPTTNTLGGELSGRREREGKLCEEATTSKSKCT